MGLVSKKQPLSSNALAGTFKFAGRHASPPKIPGEAILNKVLRAKKRFEERRKLLEELEKFSPGATTKKHLYVICETELRNMLERARTKAEVSGGRVLYYRACEELGVPRNIAGPLLRSGLVTIHSLPNGKAFYVSLEELGAALRTPKIRDFVLNMPGKDLAKNAANRRALLSGPPFTSRN